MLTEQEWMARHNGSPKFQKLPHAEKLRRYADYLRSGPNIAKAMSVRSSGVSNSRTSRDRMTVAQASAKHGLASTPQGHDYLTARFNPFCPKLVGGVGYPHPAPGGSSKYRGFAEITVQTNSLGFGYVVACSTTCGANGAVNTGSISYSTSAWTGNQPIFPPATGATGTATTQLGGIPSSTAVETSLAFRKIGFGIRVRSETALLQKAGLATSIDFPGSNGDLLGSGATMSQIRTSYPLWSKGYVLNEGRSPWISCIWSPKDPTHSYFETGFDANSAFFSAADALDTLHFYGFPGTQGAVTYRWDQGIFFEGAPNATFQCQIVGFYELIGTQRVPTMISQITPTYRDTKASRTADQSTESASLNVSQKNTEGAITVDSIFQGVLSGGQKLLSAAQGAGNALKMLESYMPNNAMQNANMDVSMLSEAPSLGGYLTDAQASMPVITDLETGAELLPMLL